MTEATTRGARRALGIIGIAVMALGCSGRFPATLAPSDYPLPTPIGSRDAVATFPGLTDADLPTLTPESVTNRTPTRVTIPDLGIDLAVVTPPPEPDHFPF